MYIMHKMIGLLLTAGKILSLQMNLVSDSDSGATEGPQEDVPRHIQDWPDREVERYIHYKSTLRQMKGDNPQRRLYELKLRALTEKCETNALEDIVRRINITAERIGPNEGNPQQWPDVPCDAGLWDPIQLEKYMELRQKYQELRRPTRANQTERVRVGAILVRIEETQQQRLDEGILIWRKFPASLIKPRDMMLQAGFPMRTIPHHSSDWTYEDARRYVAYRDALERQPPNGPRRIQYQYALNELVRKGEAKAQKIYQERSDYVRTLIGSDICPEPWPAIPGNIWSHWESKEAERYMKYHGTYYQKTLPGKNNLTGRFIMGMTIAKIEAEQQKRIEILGEEEARRETRREELLEHLRTYATEKMEEQGPPSQETLDRAWVEWELDGLTLLAMELERGNDILDKRAQLSAWARRGRMARVRKIAGYDTSSSSA